MPANVLLILPIVIPLGTAVALLLVRRGPAFRQGIGVCGMGLLLAAAVTLLAAVGQRGILVAHMGGWPAPYGITLVADHLSMIMLVVSAIIGFAGAVYALGDIDALRLRYGFFPLLHVMMAGLCGAFLAGDLFNLYVWFEVLLISSFVLMALGNTRAQLEGAVTYVVLNLVASTLLLVGIAMLYGMTGTLNLADLALRLRAAEASGLVTSVAMLFIAAFGLKAAVFPFFFWLPASYHTPPVTVSAVFAGLLTKVGVYMLIRVFTLLFIQDIDYTHELLLWIAGLTMVTGVLGAAVQNELRRILSFHIISQIGYMIMGLALYTPQALLGSVFYVVHHILVKTNLFLVSGLAARYAGTSHLNGMGGLYASSPLTSVLFALPALSLAGFPPFSGFWAKLALARAGFEANRYFIVAVALVVGLLTLYSMTKVWVRAFWAPRSDGAHDQEPADSSRRIEPAGRAVEWVLIGPIVGLLALTLAISFYATPLFDLSGRAAEELLDPDHYIEAVLRP